MAAYSHSRVGSRTSLFNGGGLAEQELPSGSCNFRDLNIGARATQCGCQRFWLNTSHINHQDAGSERAWCFCGHHACFHNAFSQQQRTLEQPLAPSQLVDVQEQAIENNIFNDNHLRGQRASSTPIKPATGLGIRPDSRSESSSINARVWQALNEFARNQEDGGMSDMASKLPSTAAPSVIEESNQSPNRIIQDRVQQYRPMAPPVNIPSNSTPRPPEEYSATEVATPSVQGTPDFRALASSSNQTRTSPGHLQPSRLEAGPHHHVQSHAQVSDSTRPNTSAAQYQPPTTDVLLSDQDIQSTLRAYSSRLDVLESMSFSHVPAEEIQEHFDLFDGRILDLEQWRTDRDNNHVSPEPATASSNKRRRLLPTETGSFGSDGSFDISAAAHTEAAVLATLAVNEELGPRFGALEERVSDLENASRPSLVRPWHVQVVFLPWGPGLKGVWFSSIEATQHSLRSATQASEEWTGAQSAPKLSFKSSASGAWTTESIQAWADEAQEWLSPKACGPSGAVFQRLASRGLVRDVILTAPDSRHITNALTDAFDEVGSIDPELYNEQTLRYQGLRESLIPLRKVRKSSRLRFLSPAEMVTSATWTASFLDSSVLMKLNDGQRRLYVTTPESYIQSSDEDWTWPKIRELPLHDANSAEQAVQAENVAIDACWSFHEQLDHHVSAHASFASRESQWSTRSQIAEQDAGPHQAQPMSPKSDAILPRQRTTSLPSSASAAEQVRGSLPKRRVASFEIAKSMNLLATESGAEVVAKRRRLSNSHEAERRGVNFTPRWSCEPPSPFTTEGLAESRSQGTSSRKRGATPFDMPYATPHSKPHSNSDYVMRMEYITGDGDTEADTEIVADHSERVEEEWEGVEDGNTNAELDQSDGESAVDEADVDESNLDDGLTIYEG